MHASGQITYNLLVYNLQLPNKYTNVENDFVIQSD